MKRPNLLLIAAGLLTLLGIILRRKENGTSGNAESILRIGMECAYAPNNWKEDKTSETNLPISNNMEFYAGGYDVQIAKHLGMEIEVLKLPWEELLETLNREQIDMGCPAWLTAKSINRRRLSRKPTPYVPRSTPSWFKRAANTRKRNSFWIFQASAFWGKKGNAVLRD